MNQSNINFKQRHVRAFALSALAVVLSSPFLTSQEPRDPVKPEAIVVAPEVAPAIPTDRLRRISIGDTLPDFTLTSPVGKEIKRADYAHRTLVLVYLSAEQRNSERAAADAARVAKKYAAKGMDLLFVTADLGHQEYFQRYFDEAHITTTLGFDGGHELYTKLGLIVFPSTLVIGADGTLKHVILTRRSDYSHLLDLFVSHALGLLTTEALQQRLIAPSMTRSSPKTVAQRHREAARLLRDNALYIGAEQELLLAIDLDAQSTPIRIDLADLYIALKRYNDAETLLNEILAKDADHRSARLLLGISRFHTGQLDEAETILLSALVMNPDPERTHYYLGRIYEQRGDLAAAVSHYRSALDRLLVE